MFNSDNYGQAARLRDLIRCAPATEESERAEWTGETQRAKFQGAANTDRAALQSAPVFGKRAPR